MQNLINTTLEFSDIFNKLKSFIIRLIHSVRFAHYAQIRYAIVSKNSHALYTHYIHNSLHSFRSLRSLHSFHSFVHFVRYVRCTRFIRSIRFAHIAQNLVRSFFSLSSAHSNVPYFRPYAFSTTSGCLVGRGWEQGANKLSGTR